MTSSDEPPFLYLTTAGRRSGNPHTIEIWFARPQPSATTLYLLSGGRHGSDWVRNVVAEPRVTVRLGSRDAASQPGQARVVDPASDDDALARRLLLEKYQAPGKTDLEEWGRTALPIAIDLDRDA